MQVILLERIKKLGDVGALVNVKAGYARNFLIPGNKAQLATKDNLAAFEQRRAELEEKSKQALTQAQQRQEQLQDFQCVIVSNVSEDGKLFGSVGPADIVEVMAKSGHEVSKKDIDMPDGVIRNTGEYAVNIVLHPEVIAVIKVIVESEGQS